MKRVFFAAVLACAALACGARPTLERIGHGRLRIAAAADLQFAMKELVREFKRVNDVDVEISYGSSGTFYAQLLNQAPYDIYMSADIEYPRKLAERGLTVPLSEFEYAVGRLVLWVPAASPLDIEGRGLQALAAASVAHVAIANPEHAPYGRAAIAALQSAGVHDALRAKLVNGDNVGQALQFVQSGAADAGIVALSLALAPDVKAQGRFVEIPLSAYPRIVQGGAILRSTKDLASALVFRSFVLGHGRSLLQQYGFSMPDAGR